MYYEIIKLSKSTWFIFLHFFYIYYSSSVLLIDMYTTGCVYENINLRNSKFFLTGLHPLSIILLADIGAKLIRLHGGLHVDKQNVGKVGPTGSVDSPTCLINVAWLGHAENKQLRKKIYSFVMDIYSCKQTRLNFIQMYRGSFHPNVNLKNRQFEVVSDSLLRSRAILTARPHKSEAHRSPHWPSGG